MTMTTTMTTKTTETPHAHTSTHARAHTHTRIQPLIGDVGRGPLGGVGQQKSGFGKAVVPPTFVIRLVNLFQTPLNLKVRGGE